MSRLARELLVEVTDDDFDHLMKRQLHCLNFNKFEEHSISNSKSNKSKTKDQLPNDFTTLRDQFVIFEQLFACVAGPSEASAIVRFWERELTAMRSRLNVDWSSAYTIWRNMLADYAVRWREWSSDDSAPPTMWD